MALPRRTGSAQAPQPLGRVAAHLADTRAITPRGLFGVGATIAMLTLVGLFLGLLRDGYSRAGTAAEATTQRAAQSAAAELGRTVQVIDALLFELAVPQSKDEAELRHHLRDLPLLRDIVVLDAGLRVVRSTDPALDGAALEAQAWLRALAQGPRQAGAPPQLGPPYAIGAEAGRPPAHWAIPLARPVTARDGTPMGAVVALMDGEQVAGLLRQSARIFGTDLRLYGADGTLHLATDLPASATGRRDADSPTFANFLPGLPTGSWRAAQDGTEVITSFVTSPRLPFVVAASQAADAAFAVWHVEALVLCASFAAVCLVVFGAFWLLFRQADTLWHQRDHLSRSERRALADGRAKQDFLAAMSHEIRTPMNGVIGMAGLLMETRLDPEQTRYTRTIQSSAEHLLTVLNDILDFSKIEAGAFELESIPFVLEEEVATVTELFAPAAAVKGVELVCRLGDGLPVAVVGDPGRFRQILLNIAGNAVKFTERGWVEIALDGTAQEDGTLLLRVTVSDTGIGVDPARLPMLFERFSQANASIARQFGGTGLGLAICRQLVQAMGGSIGAAARPGGGSEFQYTLVLRPHSGAPDADPTPLRGRRCLVVDDLPMNREIMVRQLAALGATAETAEDGVAALAMLRAAARAGTPYHLALVDRVMPGLDGMAFARAARADESLVSEEPLRLVLCASGQAGEAREGLELFDAQLLKPVLTTRLRSVIAMLATQAPLAPAPGAAAEPRPAPAAPLAGLRVLVAEDNPTNQIVTRAILQRAGAKVEVVEDGTQAVSMVRRFAFDVLLMDLQMPGMDGLQATRMIRREEAQDRDGPARRLHILGLTAEAASETGAVCRAAGMDGHLSKPVPRDELVAAVARAAMPVAA